MVETNTFYMILGIVATIGLIVGTAIGIILSRRKHKKLEAELLDYHNDKGQSMKDIIAEDTEKYNEAMDLRKEQEAQSIIKQFKEEERKDGTIHKSQEGLGNGNTNGEPTRDRTETGTNEGATPGTSETVEPRTDNTGLQEPVEPGQGVQVSDDINSGEAEPDDDINWA